MRPPHARVSGLSPVEDISAHAATQRSMIAFARGARTEVRMTLTPGLWNTASDSRGDFTLPNCCVMAC